MFCEAYNQPLTDAAAAGELSPAFEQHLASCESCRSAFADEQNLFVAIDSGLRAAANSEVPATLIPRVHVALNNEPVPQPHGFGLSIGGFAGAVVAVGVIFAMLYLPSRRPSNPIESARVSPRPIVTPPNALAPSLMNSSHPHGVSPVQRKRPIGLVAMESSKPHSPAVLVPDEERVAFAQFMAHASASTANISAKANLVPRAPQESVEISPVIIASLEVKPLDPKEARQGQF